MTQLRGDLKYPVKDLSRSLINPQDQDIKISLTCSSMSIRLESLSLSWSLSFQSGINKASFQPRLSAIQIQIVVSPSSKSTQVFISKTGSAFTADSLSINIINVDAGNAVSSHLRQGGEHQVDSVQDDLAVQCRRQVVHHGSDNHESQGAGVGLMDSAQVESAQMEAHGATSSSSPAELRSVIRITRVDESVEIMEDNQVTLPCVSVIELSFVERHSGSGKEPRRDQSTTITSLSFSQSVKSHVICLVQSFFCHFVMFLFNSLHPSDQSSVQSLSAQPCVTAAISKISATSSRLIRVIAVTFICLICSECFSDHVNGKHSQGSSGCLSSINSLSRSSRSRRCGHGVSRSHHGHQ